MKRIIFVGLHNKPPYIPLDPRSASGKRLNAAIELLEKPVQVVKTNLFDADYKPKSKQEIQEHGYNWVQKYEPNKSDIIVLLGGDVQQHFPPCVGVKVKIGHPSPLFSKYNGDEYALRLAIKLNEQL